MDGSHLRFLVDGSYLMFLVDGSHLRCSVGLFKFGSLEGFWWIVLISHHMRSFGGRFTFDVFYE